MSDYLIHTDMLDFQHTDLQTLIDQRGWRQLDGYAAIGAVYDFVRDEILFGYNAHDELKASQVLADGYGQCNTKGTLLMALLRALGIPCRLHGFTIFNRLQQGAIPTWLMPFVPERIVHSWVEVLYQQRWINLEGYIIDQRYLNQIQHRFAKQGGGEGENCTAFSGYGIATTCLAEPNINWQGEDTYIQRQGIADDYGIFAHPDDFYRQHRNLTGVKRWFYCYALRHVLNRNVRRIRDLGRF
ncbi:transglutaminase [Bacterioplanes sanyensis]|uniref:Transglutaminase n=1 Tax=Bacterioplanes sanyensis TaxID=1249553 RepID=A0A222FKL7_9GAMM|nr:transglutaminase family protein [Bacterioplanes sanyensis]ASP39575.1 transglutaminase [Bacterioplanes sanyensis]